MVEPGHVARILGLDLEHVTAQMPGFNHWIWMTDFRYEGENAYPLLECIAQIAGAEIHDRPSPQCS